MNVAIQGEAGSFHELAAKEWFGEACTIYPCLSFADEFDAFESEDVEAIVCAVENTIYGSINEVYPLIEACSSPIIGEVKLAIAQQLVGCKNTPLDKITEIYSHPVALAQCRETLSRVVPNAELIEFFDTAAAVGHVKQMKDSRAAAIAGVQAAKLHGMPILAKDIQDDAMNFTRFLVIAPQDTPKDACRSSLVITTAHKPGALAEVLNVFARRNINLEKLLSQPKGYFF